MLSTNIGKMRHRVTWYSATETNTNGQIGTTYTNQGDFWASVIPTGGGEATVSNKVQANITHKVVMRRVGVIKPKDKLIFETRTLQIESVQDTNERKRELILACREVV